MSDFTDYDNETNNALHDLDDADLAVCSVRVLLDTLGEVLGLAEAGQ